ncbi:MAG: ASKHA domain-containing protein, partial [Spirochaetia bacterium]|nr:ASKHA domain-containing protein [Spirochaetia bacterium]
PFGGAGTCGKCRVRIVSGDAGEVEAEERRLVGNAGLAAGIRLACHVRPLSDINFEKAETAGAATIHEAFSVLSGTIDPLLKEAGTYGVAVDIGTTTVAAYLVDFSAGEVLTAASCLNSQRAWGADVIARIDHAGKDPANLAYLADLARKDLSGLANRLLASVDASHDALREISVVGNTTMLHLFAGVDPSGIAVAPFTPAFIALQRKQASEYGLPYPKAMVTLGPSVAGYVGADLVAGIRAVGLEERERLSLILDLGTNGEMALGNKDGIVACATAAGPAFEGAAISCGTGGVAGAIDSLLWNEGRLEWTTIGDQSPIGVCGSGIIDAAACLVRGGIADDTGAFADPWSEEGYPLAGNNGKSIYFTQGDMRQIQLAKAAVAAGIASMLDDIGAGLDDVESVFLAGGFGSYLRPASAAAIGLIPPQLLPKVQAVGNAAGHGAVRMLLFKDEGRDLSSLATAVRYLELSGLDFFRDRFVEELFFPEPVDPVVPAVSTASVSADTQ